MADKNLAERMGRLAERKTPRADLAGAAALKPRDRVPLTVRVDEDTYNRLKEWPVKVGLTRRLNRRNVPTLYVIVALIDELFESDDLARRIQNRVIRNWE